jgi:hypothetical protein
MNDWANDGLGYSTAAFYRDRAGVVHLKGVVKLGTADTVFLLPSGYRPELDRVFAAASDDGLSTHVAGQIYVRGPSSNSGHGDGTVEAVVHGDQFISLDGVAFRCAPTGADGCP